MPSGTLSPILRRLTEDKRVLTIDEPLSTRTGRPALYPISDSNLRLYLAAHHAAVTEVPGHTPGATGTAIVSLSGTTPAVDTHTVDLLWGPGDIIEAWH